MLDKYFKNAVSNDFLFEVGRGSIPGFTPITITGNNDDLDSTLETIWDLGGIYNFPPTPLKFSLSSASTNDTSDGTGARQIFIAGLDSEGYWQAEAISLNGQTAVLTSKTYSRLNYAYVCMVGSAGRNLGKVYIGTGTPVAGVLPTVYGLIDGTANTHDNVMKQAVFSVPKGYKALVTGFVLGVQAAKEGTFSLYAKENGVTRGGGELILYQNPMQISLRSPFKFLEMADLEVRGFSDVSDLFARINLTIILERIDENVPFILPKSLMPSTEWGE